MISYSTTDYEQLVKTIQNGMRINHRSIVHKDMLIVGKYEIWGIHADMKRMWRFVK